jgi:uncharacterized protein YhbP (UPF0306 family)
MSNEDIARQIIKESTYMTLATSDGDEPWACALFFGVDASFNFYFVSSCRTKHVGNVLKNPKVALTIFDSHAVSGQANGVQLSGTCERLTGDKVQVGIDAIYGKRYPDSAEHESHNLTVEEFSKPDTDSLARHIYRIKPEHVYTLDKTTGEDARIEIYLNS